MIQIPNYSITLNLITMKYHILLSFLSLLFFSCDAASSVQENNTMPVSHELWDKLLKRHVSLEGKVNYKGFIQDSVQLNTYLETLSKNAPNKKNWSKDEQKAYWLNAYNAFTVQLIIRHYPLQSIKDIGSKIKIPFVNTPWDIKFIKIGTETYDLNNIEHDILRKDFDDPRVHFAMVCAAKSCPRLRNEAFVPSKVNQQLDDQGRDFLSNTYKNKITANRVQLSKIFSWFKDDFTKKGSLIDFLNKYTDVKINPNSEVDYLDYDWALNE